MRYIYTLLVDENGKYVVDDQGRFVIAGYREVGVMSGRGSLFSGRSSILTASKQSLFAARSSLMSSQGPLIATGPQLPVIPAFDNRYGTARYGLSRYTTEVPTGIYGESSYDRASYA